MSNDEDSANPTRSEHAVSMVVVDDDQGTADIIGHYLRTLGAEVHVYTNPKACIAALEKGAVDILITDINMPGMDGLALLRKVKECSPATDVIMVTGNADKKVAISALKSGAFDFFEKPVDREELLATVSRTVKYRQAVAESKRLAQQISLLTRQETAKWGLDAFVGKSPAIRDVVRKIRLLHGVTMTSVLITGESGTGKELVARAIHYGGVRSSAAFVPVNCSAIPGELAESVLFGHAKGAFTGATSDKRGHFEMADGGTIFLDEVGDMPAAIQTKLLRVLEDALVVPVGATQGRKVDVRVVAATNADLMAKVSSGAFRQDLFYRLAGFLLHIPPLRDRREDIPLLAEYFVRSLSSEMGFACPPLYPETITELCKHDFPGNVRELRNIIERALLESGGKPITPSHLHFIRMPGAPAQSTTGATRMEVTVRVPLDLCGAEAVLVREAMATGSGNVSKAARLLGISRQKLYRKLAALEMQP
jgi:DNA-binding NtrC family response regulator